MKLLIQRVSQAAVEVDEHVIGSIDTGILALIGFEKHDDLTTLTRARDKLLGYRIFADDADKMNLSVTDINGGVLLVSQFTLAADTRKGLRPSFSSAASPEQAKSLYVDFVNSVRSVHSKVETGEFAANMQVSLVNNGPVTFLLEF